MKAFFKEMFEYSHKFNQEYIALMLREKNQTTQKAQKLMSHIVNAQQIWNNRIEKTIEPAKVWQVHPIEQLAEIDTSNFQASVTLVNKSDFDKEITYVNSQGMSFTNKIRDILFHVINHSTYHRAQIASELKAKGVEPPVSDYIFYKR